MDFTLFAERLYIYVTGEVTVLALLLAFASLVARLLGLRRGVTMSRPAALYGMIGTIGALMVFYLLFAVTGEPASIAARGGVVRLLLINHSLALLHWNWDYVCLAIRRWRVVDGSI
jgi:hypothetical protein